MMTTKAKTTVNVYKQGFFCGRRMTRNGDLLNMRARTNDEGVAEYAVFRSPDRNLPLMVVPVHDWTTDHAAALKTYAGWE